MAQQKIFKSRLSAKDFIKFSNQNNNSVSSSPRWQYYSGAGSQRIVIHDHHPRVSSEHFRVENRKHVTRVSVNNGGVNNHTSAVKTSYQSRSLSDLRFLLPDVTSVSFEYDIDKRYIDLQKVCH